MCRASGGSQPAWKEMLGICRHHNPATETGGYLNDGAQGLGSGQEESTQPEVGSGRRHYIHKLYDLRPINFPL